ncbi:unnamed protein product [Lathyrus oleraceus]
MFPNVKLVNLLASHFNHSPFLLQGETVQISNNKFSFKFENKWLQEEDITVVVKSGWKQREDVEIENRILSCAGELESWSSRKMRIIKDEIAGYLEKMELYRNSDEEELVTRFFDAQQNHNKSFVQEETFWK